MWAAPTSGGRVCGAGGPASAPLPRSGPRACFPRGLVPSAAGRVLCPTWSLSPALIPSPHPGPREANRTALCSAPAPRGLISGACGLGEGWVSCVSTISLYSDRAPFRTAVWGGQRGVPHASRRPRNSASPFIHPHFRAHVRPGSTRGGQPALGPALPPLTHAPRADSPRRTVSGLSRPPSPGSPCPPCRPLPPPACSTLWSYGPFPGLPNQACLWGWCWVRSLLEAGSTGFWWRGS